MWCLSNTTNTTTNPLFCCTGVPSMEERLALIEKRLHTLESLPVLYATSPRHHRSGKWEKSYWTPLKTTELELPLSTEPHENIYMVMANSLVLNVSFGHPNVSNNHVTCLVLKYHNHNPDTNYYATSLHGTVSRGSCSGFFESMDTLLESLPSCHIVVMEGIDDLNHLGMTSAFTKHSTRQFVLRYNDHLNKKSKREVTENWVVATRALNNVIIS